MSSKDRKEVTSMKKFFALVLATMMICAVMTTAMAEIPISWSGSDTVAFHSWTDPIFSDGAEWSIGWGECTNISSNHRAVVRVYSGNRVASAKWVYSAKKATPHPYAAEFADGNAMVTLYGRLDNRDTGLLVVDGIFYN